MDSGGTNLSLSRPTNALGNEIDSSGFEIRLN